VRFFEYPCLEIKGNVAAGFSLRLQRLERECHQNILSKTLEPAGNDLIILFKNGARVPDQKDENPDNSQDNPFQHGLFSRLCLNPSIP
jgi:hypothetical protein